VFLLIFWGIWFAFKFLKSLRLCHVNSCVLISMRLDLFLCMHGLHWAFFLLVGSSMGLRFNGFLWKWWWYLCVRGWRSPSEWAFSCGEFPLDSVSHFGIERSIYTQWANRTWVVFVYTVGVFELVGANLYTVLWAFTTVMGRLFATVYSTFLQTVYWVFLHLLIGRFCTVVGRFFLPLL